MRTSVVLVSAIVFGGFAGTYLRTSPSVAAASGQPPTELVEIAGRLDDIQRRLNEHDQYFNNIQGVFNQLGASNLESRLNCLENGGRLEGLGCVTVPSQVDFQPLLSSLDHRLSCLEIGGKLNTLGSCETP